MHRPRFLRNQTPTAMKQHRKEKKEYEYQSLQINIIYIHSLEPVKTLTIICITFTLICKHTIYSAVSLKRPPKPLGSLLGISFFRVLTFFWKGFKVLVQPSGILFINMLLDLLLHLQWRFTVFPQTLCFLTFILLLDSDVWSLKSNEGRGNGEIPMIPLKPCCCQYKGIPCTTEPAGLRAFKWAIRMRSNSLMTAKMVGTNVQFHGRSPREWDE